jgi:apolipoprotein D and lipocalin family protein
MTTNGIQGRLLAVLFIAIAALNITTAARAGKQPPPETVAFVDLDRYLGTWYEIASIPNRFQKHCRGNTMARYRMIEHERIEVTNSCLDKDGTVDTARGVARIVDTTSNARLEVSFVSLFGWQLFWGDYWVLDLAPDYTYAVVGTPDYRFGWILSRTPSLNAEIRLRIERRLRESGYDPTSFHDTAQELD